jgi:hypothetical protein
MQYLESAASRAAHPLVARWIRNSAAVLLTLAAPAISTSGALTTGLKGTSPAVMFPPGYWVALAATVAVTALAGVLAALIARRDALVTIPVSLGLWFIIGLSVVVAGIQLGHSGLAHWGGDPGRRVDHRSSRRHASCRPPRPGAELPTARSCVSRARNRSATAGEGMNTRQHPRQR